MFTKNAKIKCIINKNLIRIVRKKSHSYGSSCRVKKGTPLPWSESYEVKDTDSEKILTHCGKLRDRFTLYYYLKA